MMELPPPLLPPLPPRPEPGLPCPLPLQGCTEALPTPIKVVGMGSSGQDLLAQVRWG